MSKKVIEDTDDHLVVHDAATVAIAGVLGVVGTAITGSPEIGLATSGIAVATGIGSMRIGPVRRGVNAAALALTEGRGKDKTENPTPDKVKA